MTAHEPQPQLPSAPLLTRAEYLKYAVDHAGNADRGKKLFSDSMKTRCGSCHLLTGVEKSVPNLDGIADKYAFEQLARQILVPSEFIAHGFEQINILMTDGKLFAGRMERSNQIEVKLVNAEGKINSIKRKQIEEIKELSTSFMPADLHQADHARRVEF